MFFMIDRPWFALSLDQAGIRPSLLVIQRDLFEFRLNPVGLCLQRGEVVRLVLTLPAPGLRQQRHLDQSPAPERRVSPASCPGRKFRSGRRAGRYCFSGEAKLSVSSVADCCNRPSLTSMEASSVQRCSLDSASTPTRLTMRCSSSDTASRFEGLAACRFPVRIDVLGPPAGSAKAHSRKSSPASQPPGNGGRRPVPSRAPRKFERSPWYGWSPARRSRRPGAIPRRSGSPNRVLRTAFRPDRRARRTPQGVTRDRPDSLLRPASVRDVRRLRAAPRPSGWSSRPPSRRRSPGRGNIRRA